MEDNKAYLFITIKDSLKEMVNVLDIILHSTELKMKFFQDGLKPLMESAKSLQENQIYMAKHSDADELTNDQIKELEEIERTYGKTS